MAPAPSEVPIVAVHCLYAERLVFFSAFEKDSLHALLLCLWGLLLKFAISTEAVLTMDLEELMRALQSTQQQKSSVRLSERNVVELVNKLKQLGYLGDDLLYTINGKEYITTDRLRADIQDALKQSGGRLELVELPALVGVDLVHCERQVRARNSQLVRLQLARCFIPCCRRAIRTVRA